jgi:hypothetical protein
MGTINGTHTVLTKEETMNKDVLQESMDKVKQTTPTLKKGFHFLLF